MRLAPTGRSFDADTPAPAFPGLTGRGLMREALAAILAWGFEHMQLHRVEAQVHEDNGPSIALLHAPGFAREGRLREVAFWGNRHHDLLQYSLLACERATMADRLCIRPDL